MSHYLFGCPSIQLISHHQTAENSVSFHSSDNDKPCNHHPKLELVQLQKNLYCLVCADAAISPFSRSKTFDLFGPKATTENLIGKIHRFSNLGIDVNVHHSLPNRICHSCYPTVTNLDRKANAFEERCKASEKKQLESSERSKRQRRVQSELPLQVSPTVSSPVRKVIRTSKEGKPVKRRLDFLRPKPSSSTSENGV